MKKILISLFIFVCAMFVLSACSGSDDEIETYYVTEESITDEQAGEVSADITETEYFTDENGEVLFYNENGETEYMTIVAPTGEEMSPKHKDVTMPYEIEYKLTELKSLKVIDPKDSVYPDTNADYVYSKGDSQYFYYSNGELVTVTMKSDGSTYACYYNSNGEIQFCSDDTMSWYFNSDKTIEHIVYTYYNAFTRGYVYTFYSAEGERLYVSVNGLIYDADLNELEGEAYNRFIIEYADTQEVVAEK